MGKLISETLNGIFGFKVFSHLSYKQILCKKYFQDIILPVISYTENSLVSNSKKN